jgi:hypothetical protein
MTVLGFVRDDRFNIYTGAERIRESGSRVRGQESGISNGSQQRALPDSCP